MSKKRRRALVAHRNKRGRTNAALPRNHSIRYTSLNKMAPLALIVLAFIAFLYYTSAVRERKTIVYDKEQIMRNLLTDNGRISIIKGRYLDGTGLKRLSAMGYFNVKSMLNLHTDFALYIVSDKGVVPLDKEGKVLCFGSRKMRVNGEPCRIQMS